MKRRGFLAGIAALATARLVGLERVGQVVQDERLTSLGSIQPTRFPDFPRTMSGGTIHFGTDEIRAALFTSEAP